MTSKFHLLFAFLLLLVWPANGCLAAKEEIVVYEQLESANAMYVQGEYMEAIDIYSAIIARHGLSTEILHNLANSYAAAGKNGQAILHYIRGLRIDPGNDDLEADLAATRAKVGLFDDSETALARFFKMFDMNQWLGAALVFYGLLSLTLLISLQLSRRGTGKKPVTVTATGLALLLLVALSGAYYQHGAWKASIVIRPDTRLLLSPFPTASSRGILLEGTMVNGEKRHNDYVYVRDKRGRAGWVQAAALARINTSAVTYSPGSAER